MKRIIYTTCGTSLLISSCWEGRSHISTKSTDHATKAQIEAQNSKFIEKYMDDPDGLVKKFDKECWKDTTRLRQLPAELASLRVIEEYCKRIDTFGGPLNSSDKIMLVHADNEDAKFCASVIDKLLKDNDMKLMGDVSTEDEPWKISKLDASEPKEFEQALQKLWNEEMSQRIPSSGAEHLCFNITGGYKPLIALFACFGFRKGRGKAHIFYLNEESGENILIMGFDHERPSPISRVASMEVSTFDISGKKVVSQSIQPLELGS